MTEEAVHSIVRLDGWILRNGWVGYDPYDIRGHPWILRLLSGRYQHQNSVTRLASGPLLAAIELFPQLSRKVLNVKKEVNAKAMGLFASAYLALYLHSKDDQALCKANECLEWLEKNQSRGYSGPCWGLPFHWQSLVFIPQATPIASVTAICGDAFWRFYMFTGDKEYLDICESICDFFIRDLHIDCVDNDEICFSYTPVDRFHIHNGNLFVAEFLIRIGKETDNDHFYSQGVKALKYTLDAQNDDGSFYYWALGDKDVYNIPDAILKYIDHYHTGFILRSLHSIYINTGDKTVLQALSSGYEFYRQSLFEDRKIPMLRPNGNYPVNIHSCAEAILCMSTLDRVFPGALEHAWKVFLWTRENMQDADGHFYYTKTALRTNKMPYIRWGQAWMMRALSELLVCLDMQER